MRKLESREASPLPQAAQLDSGMGTLVCVVPRSIFSFSDLKESHFLVINKTINFCNAFIIRN